jgi:hypothetical protein
MSTTFRPGDVFDLDCEMTIAVGNVPLILALLGSAVVKDSEDMEAGHIPVDKLFDAISNVRFPPVRTLARFGDNMNQFEQYQLRLCRLIGFCEGANVPLNWS